MATRSMMKMAGQTIQAVMIAVAVLGYSSTAASAGTDPMRCEALKLRCASRYHMCLSRCDGVADRRAVRSPEDAEDLRRRCSDSCDTRHVRMQERLEQRPVCKDPDPVPVPPANPQACAAELLWVTANFIQCKGRCHARFDQRPAFGCDDCVSQCYDGYRADVEATNDKAICGEGPAELISIEAEPAPCGGTD